MMKTARYAISLLLALTAVPVLADTRDEIRHLLQYVEINGCEFERNGTVYDSGEARAHMERKYNYVKSRVDVAEDFIRYAATESSMSGKKYHVTCNGIKRASADWLQEELSRYRETNL